MATRRALRLLLVLSTKKQNCFCQLLSDTRQRTHRYTNNHIQKKKKKELNSPNWWREAFATQHPFSGSSREPKDALSLVSDSYMSPGWLHLGSTPSGHMGSTGAASIYFRMFTVHLHLGCKGICFAFLL